jgi:predicted ATPase/class 3 adenylate cyclase
MLTAAESSLPAEAASYAPAWVRRRLAEGVQAPAAGEHVELTGAVLFADVSGFTPLADRLALRGAAGAEELSRLLNDYFGLLLAVVAEHGGEPFKFAGDALMALWPAAAADLATATQRAAACALAIQTRLRHFETPGSATLSLRVAVGQGSGSGMQLEANGRWFGVVGGPPLSDALRALSRAHAREAVVSADAWNAIVARASGAPAGLGCWRLTHVDPPPPLQTAPLSAQAEAQAAAQAAADATANPHPLLHAYVPEPARARLAVGHGAWLGELRHVTALFAHVGGLDHLHASAPQRLQAVLRAAQPIVQRCQGHLHELVVDDKGVVLVALFGLPPAGHEDGAARGTRAALDLCAALDAIGHPGAVGVTTGVCFCGVVGSAIRREYTVVGDAMNVASRLMDAARLLHDTGGSPRVLCDEATWQSATGKLDFRVLDPISVKGKSEPLAVAQPTGAHERRTNEARSTRPGTQLIGRQAERLAISEALHRCRQGGTAGTLLLIGEAGMGKTRLVAELLAQAAALGITALHGEADAIEAATPYFAWRRPFAELLGLQGLPAGSDNTARRNAALAKLASLGPAHLARAPLLEAVATLGLPDTPETAQMSGQQRATATRELLLDLLTACASASTTATTTATTTAAPTAVVLEDAHWFDAASWALLLEASRRIPQLQLSVTARPLGDVEPLELTALQALPHCQRLNLQPLSGEETLAVVCARLGVPGLPPDVDSMIRSRAAGLPLFAEELGLALLETGVIEIQDGRCKLTHGVDLAALELPDTVQGVVTARIDRLTPREALAIKVGSVIGTSFGAQILGDVHPVRDDVGHLQEALVHLREAELTVQEAPDPQLTYAFKHIVTREVAYNLMLFAQRRQLHQAVAEWYEAHIGEQRSEMLALLAHHWARAGVVPKAVAYLEEGAMRSFSLGLARVAVGQGLEAARLLGVHLPTEPEAIRPLLGAELARIEALLDGRAPADLLNHWPLADEETGTIVTLLLRLLPYAHVSLQAELFALMSLRCMSLTLLHGNGPAAPLVYAMHSVIYRGMTGNVVGANRYAELALQLDARNGGQLLGQVSFIYTWFNQHWIHPVARAFDMQQRAAEAAFAQGDVLYACFNLSSQVMCHAAAGTPLARVMAIAREQLQRIAGRVHISAWHCIQELQFAKAMAGLTRGPTSLSDDEFDEQRDIASICATDNYNQFPYYFIARMRLHFHAGEYAAALEFADQAQGLLPVISGQTGEFELVFFHALTLLARARELPAGERAPLLEKAQGLHAQLQAWAQLCEANYAHKAQLVAAELTRQAGTVDSVGYGEAAQAAAAAGYTQHEALAHELHAQALRAARIEGWRAALERARDAYARWGAAGQVARLQALAA